MLDYWIAAKESSWEQVCLCRAVGSLRVRARLECLRMRAYKSFRLGKRLEGYTLNEMTWEIWVDGFEGCGRLRFSQKVRISAGEVEVGQFRS